VRVSEPSLRKLGGGKVRKKKGAGGSRKKSSRNSTKKRAFTPPGISPVGKGVDALRKAAGGLAGKGEGQKKASPGANAAKKQVGGNGGKTIIGSKENDEAWSISPRKADVRRNCRGGREKGKVK